MTPPHNLLDENAEWALMATILFGASRGQDRDYFQEARERVSFADFGDPRMAIFWDACEGVAELGHTVYHGSVKELLRSRGQLDDSAARDVFESLDAFRFEGVWFDANLKIVHRLGRRRRLHEAGGRIAALAGGPDKDISVSEMIASALSEITDLDTENAVFDWSGARESAVETMAEIRKAVLSGEQPGLLCGIHKFDTFLGGFHAGDLVVLAGRPSMGKSAMARNIAQGVANAGGHVAVFSQEMSKQQLDLRTVAAESRRAGKGRIAYRDAYNARLTMHELAALEETAGALTDTIAWHTAAGQTVSDIAIKSRKARRKLGGLDMIVIDYLQIMEVGWRPGQNHAVAIANVTKSLKALAKELGVPILLLSQLSREVDRRDDKRPILSDLRDSGAIEQDADTVIFAYRDSYYIERDEPDWEDEAAHAEWRAKLKACRHRLDVIVAKQRMGKIGPVELWFEKETDLVLSDASELAKTTVRAVQ